MLSNLRKGQVSPRALEIKVAQNLGSLLLAGFGLYTAVRTGADAESWLMFAGGILNSLSTVTSSDKVGL
jgi:hypothetical protein